ncbi:MAG: NHLP leader peptide family RiPP precursor [Xanthobacteraceae bacterium]
MTDPQQPIDRRSFEARIIAKAWKDPNYKQRLLANPKGVLQQEVASIDPSVVLPSSLQVQVHQESPDVYHLVLPRNPQDISLGELLGDNLEAVAPQTIAVVTAITQITNVQTNYVVIQGVVQAVNIVSAQVATNLTSVVSNVIG